MNPIGITVEFVVTPAVPVINLSDTVFCGTVTLDAGNPGCTYLWSTGDTTQTITLDSNMVVNLLVTSSQGCTATGNATITDNTPVADFTATQTALGEFDFLNNSYPAGGANGTTYYWSFDNGDTSALENLTYTYTNNGVYTVVLIVSNSCGSDTVFQKLAVNGLYLGGENESNNIRVFPNPASGHINIICDVNINKIQLQNSLGQVLLANDLVHNSSTRFNIASIQTGMYFLTVITNLGQYKFKIFILK